MKGIWIVAYAGSLAIGLLAASALAQTSVGSAFTYQGQLKQGGVPVMGTVGALFRLYDAESDGTVIGSIGPMSGEVVNGLFTVELDFGTLAFNGQARWLQIEIEFPEGGGNWIKLSPRQRLTPTPYASTAISTVGVDGHSLDAADGSPIDVVRVDDYGRVRLEVGGLTVFDNLAQGISFNSDDFYFAEGASEDPVYVYSSDTDSHEFWTDGSRRMVIDAGGKVGIGTNTPEAGLHLEGPGFPAAFMVLNSTGGNNDTGMRLKRDGEAKWHIFNASPADDLAIRNLAYAPVVTATQNGDVGVGTISPAHRLHVESSGSGGAGVYGRHTSTSGTAAGVHGVTDSEAFEAAGVLGEISSLTPGSSSAGVRGVNNGATGYGVRGTHSGLGSGVHGWAISGTGTSGYTTSGRGVSGTSVTGPGVYAQTGGTTVNNPAVYANNTNGMGIGIFSMTDSADANTVLVNQGIGPLLCAFSGETAWETVFEVLNNGQVNVNNTDPDGIGILTTTESTDANLVVRNLGSGDIIRGFSGPTGWDLVFRVLNNGTTVTSVLHITGGSDLSEGFDINTRDGAAGPGSVVCIDPDSPGELIMCSKAFDRTVAGVISGAGGVKPGMVMGQEGTEADGGTPVALTGRVYVKCDASKGAIVPGDLLTTSNTPGHAAKVNDHIKAQGAILGKAMSTLDEGTGLVLALVSLQ